MKSLIYAFLLVLCFGAAGYSSATKINTCKEPIIPIIPEEEEEPTVYTYTPRTRTGITEPDGSTVWHHGETGAEVSWSGISDALVKLELYHNGAFVCQLCSWIEDVSSFTRFSSVPESWGSGSGYQIKLIDGMSNEYWSDEFTIRSQVTVTYPDETACWSAGTLETAVAWEGCQGNQVKCEIYQNGSYVGDYSGWVNNDGSVERNVPIPSSWGTGSGFQIHVIDDHNNEGWSKEFDIGSIPVIIDGNSIAWTGGFNVIKVELYEGSRLISDLSGWIDNTGSFNLRNASIPSGYTPGRGECRIRVVDNIDGFGWGGGSSFMFGGSGPLADMEFISIPSGSFQMGSPSSESGRDSDEARHSVYVNSFELMTTEVTQGMWEEVMGESASSHHEMSKGSGANYPMYYVSWNDCQDFIDELNDLDPNHTYRLPSEAEWEYACRAGTTTRFYWGNSDSESTMGRYCWYTENSGSSTHPVGEKQPNTWGLYDMSGNVWEWCEDVYTSDYDDCPTDGSAHRGSGSSRVERGGSWDNGARGCRSANRDGSSPGSSSNELGFRLARSVL